MSLVEEEEQDKLESSAFQPELVPEPPEVPSKAQLLKQMKERREKLRSLAAARTAANVVNDSKSDSGEGSKAAVKSKETSNELPMTLSEKVAELFSDADSESDIMHPDAPGIDKEENSAADDALSTADAENQQPGTHAVKHKKVC